MSHSQAKGAQGEGTGSELSSSRSPSRQLCWRLVGSLDSLPYEAGAWWYHNWSKWGVRFGRGRLVKRLSGSRVVLSGHYLVSQLIFLALSFSLWTTHWNVLFRNKIIFRLQKKKTPVQISSERTCTGRRGRLIKWAAGRVVYTGE